MSLPIELSSIFVDWVMICMTTLSCVINMNGEPHGYFLSAWGLRQGDPLSAYLVILCMKVLALEGRC